MHEWTIENDLREIKERERERAIESEKFFDN